MAESKAGGSKTGVKAIVELIVTVVVAVGLALLIQAFIVKPYRIPSGSMLPTLQIGQRVLANRLISHPSLGDIVVFHPPAGADPQQGAICGDGNQGAGHPQPCDKPTAAESKQTFIKRVVGVPGDTISISSGHVVRNGVAEHDSYIAPCGPGGTCTFPQSIKVPPGEYFMMGDNRGESDDSRFWGPVPDNWIIGVAFATYWPPDRIGIF
jgi:signal peptidase I